MAAEWEEQRNELCLKIEDAFHLPKFKNRDYPIIALTSNDRISKDTKFNKEMKPDGKKDLAAIGDTVIDFLIVEYFLDEKSQISAKELNSLREKYGNNKILHMISKTPDVNLKNYIIRTNNDRCVETGKICLAVYFEALVGIIFIDLGINEARKFLKTISFFDNVEKINESI